MGFQFLFYRDAASSQTEYGNVHVTIDNNMQRKPIICSNKTFFFHENRMWDIPSCIKTTSDDQQVEYYTVSSFIQQNRAKLLKTACETPQHVKPAFTR